MIDVTAAPAFPVYVGGCMFVSSDALLVEKIRGHLFGQDRLAEWLSFLRSFPDKFALRFPAL